MRKHKIIILLFPLLLTSCLVDRSFTSNRSSASSESSQLIPISSDSNHEGSSEGDDGSDASSASTIPVEDLDAYEDWLNSWSKPDHLYFHYNRGAKGGYDNYCLWLWQHDPQDLEGSLWGFSSNPKVSDNLTLKPMSNHWMTGEEVGKEGTDTYIDSYGVIADVDLYNANLVGGKTGKETTFRGMKEIGFLLPQQSSMNGATNWVSDGGRETYIDDIAEDENWRTVKGGKAIHIFVSTGALYDYSYRVGNGTAQVVTNPIEEDLTGKYRSAIDTKYSNDLGISSTADSFKSLGVGYQVFVASFRDSDGDGIGDIQGVIDSLNYLKDLGVQVLWLTPIQKSDSYHGYDISDYYAVDKRFGTIKDYRELLFKAHEKGMKVLMDLVLNHTSKGNVWFTNSQWGKVDNDINWRDVYSWKYETDEIEKYNPDTKKYETITVKKDAESSNPSWYRDGESHYYYYGKFGSGMPEINYLNPSTRELVINMAKYWLSFGLDGFRLDAVKHIFMRDECYQNGDIIIEDVGDKESFDDERGIYVTKGYDYSSNLTKNIMWWKEFAYGVKADYPDCFLVGENFDGWGTRTAPYYQALDSQFSFSMYYHVPAYLYADGVGAKNFANKQAGESFIPFATSENVRLGDQPNSPYIPGGSRPDFIDGAFTSNHDVMRAINQVNYDTYKPASIDGTKPSTEVTVDTPDAVNKAKIHAALTLLNPGVSWIYYGDELGMSSNTNTHKETYGSENCEDIWYRQPFLWHEEEGKDSVRPSYKSGQYQFELDSYNKTLPDVEAQKADANSMYNWYKDLIRIKKMYPKGAKLEFHEWSSKNVLILKVMDANGDAKLAIYINVGTSEDGYDLNADGVLGVASPTNVMTMGGAPSENGANIGATKWSISVFKK